MSLNWISDQEVTRELSGYGLAFFCGAGVSIEPPADLPSWAAFRDALLKALVGQVINSGAVDQSSFSDLRVLVDADIPPELVVSACADYTAGFERALDIFTQGEPSEWHRLISSRSRDGHVSLIITTNFDLLFEKACR